MLPHVESLLKKPVQNPARGSGPYRSFISAFYLSKNFRLTQDHRFQARSNPEQMSDRRDSLQPKKMLELAKLHGAVKIMKKWFDGQLRILRNNIEFRPVASRQQYAFLHIRNPRKSRQRIGQRGVRNRESFPDFDICRLMTDAETEDIHLKRWTIRNESNPPEGT